MEQQQIIVLGIAATCLLIGVGATLFVSMLIQRKKRQLLKVETERQESIKKQEILKAVISAQEEERNRIATNLHDSVGAELSMLKLNLSKYAYYFRQAKIEAEPFQKDIDNLDETIENIRTICRDLYPISLTSLGFVKTFENLMSRINRLGKINCKYRMVIREHDFPEDMEFKLSLLRIFQEIINNVIKYSESSYLDIGFIKEESILKILLKHNGSGFDNSDVQEKINNGKGVGLLSIQNRVYLMNGKIDYFKVNNGSEIILSLPLTHVKKN